MVSILPFIIVSSAFGTFLSIFFLIGDGIVLCGVRSDMFVILKMCGVFFSVCDYVLIRAISNSMELFSLKSDVNSSKTNYSVEIYNCLAVGTWLICFKFTYDTSLYGH